MKLGRMRRTRLLAFVFAGLSMVSCASGSAMEDLIDKTATPATPVPAEAPRDQDVVKEIAITIDDLPVVGGWQMSQEEKLNTFTSVVDSFDKYGIKVQGFIIGKEIELIPSDYLDVFVNRGHRLDNHTYSHYNLNEKPTGVFIKDIEEGEKMISRWQKGEKYFRYPMLVRGDSMERRKEVETYLKHNGYTIVPVTIDSTDWKYNTQFVEALKAEDREKGREIGKEYIKHVQEQTSRAMRVSREKEKRQVRHILLIHMNKINSVYLKNILDWYSKNGWKFISVERALQDPVYAKNDSYIGEWGQTWLQMLYGQ